MKKKDLSNLIKTLLLCSLKKLNYYLDENE